MERASVSTSEVERVKVVEHLLMALINPPPVGHSDGRDNTNLELAMDEGTSYSNDQQQGKGDSKSDREVGS